LLAEIAEATKEQSQGIAQINQAVGEIEKATQTNVGEAERLVKLTSRFNISAGAEHDRARPQQNDALALSRWARQDRTGDTQ
jgi:methyl-accepting chemotaxis protein